MFLSKDSSKISARSDSVQRHTDSPSGAVTHSQTQTGVGWGLAVKPQLPFVVFVQKRKKKREVEKMKKTDNTEKQILLFLKVTNHTGQETFVFILGLDCTI